MYPHLHLFSLPVTLQPPLPPTILAPGNMRVLCGYVLYHLFIYRPTILCPILVVAQTLTLILPLMNKKVLFKEISLLDWFFSSIFLSQDLPHNLSPGPLPSPDVSQLPTLSLFFTGEEMSIDFKRNGNPGKSRSHYTERGKKRLNKATDKHSCSSDFIIRCLIKSKF